MPSWPAAGEQPGRAARSPRGTQIRSVVAVIVELRCEGLGNGDGILPSAIEAHLEESTQRTLKSLTRAGQLRKDLLEQLDI